MRPRTIEEWMRDQERDDTPAGRRKRALIPEKYREMSWDQYTEDAYTSDESLKEILQFYVNEWTDKTREGIVLLGPPGYGKTAGMALLACELIDKGAWVRWISWGDLTLRKRQLISMARRAEETDDWEQHEREELRLRWITDDCDVLFLDDVGKEYRHASGWSDTELEHILRSRTAAGKVTMITSNLKWEEWKQYNNSMASFLREVGEVVRLEEGVDHRDDTHVDSPRARRRRRGTR